MISKIKALYVGLFFISTSYLYAHSLEKVSIQLQWLDQFQFAGYYIAKEKGFYKDAGLDVEIKKYTFNTDVVKEVTSHKTNFGIGRSSLLINRSKGEKVVLLSAIFQSSPLILLTTPKSGIKTINDFVNKRIMYSPDVAETISLQAMTSKYGVTNKMKVFKRTFNIDDLIDGKIDLIAAYTSNEPFLLKQRGIKPVIFHPKDYGFNFYNDILFTSEQEIKQHKQRVIKFQKASLKGWEYAFSHIDESINIILKKYNTQHKSREALVYEANELKNLAYIKGHKLGEILQYKIQRLYDLYNVVGLLTN
jgi:ABC-type nitrate/sulfonate/bicarbonate transport system substrate-binding protein